jgi:hypothetical protein
MGTKSNREAKEVKTKTSSPKYLSIIALVIGAAIGMAGCADYVGVDVAHAGYNAAYYTPDYQAASSTYYAASYQPAYAAYYTSDYEPVYSGYYYGGAPWWGAGYYYGGDNVVVKDVNKYVNVNRYGYSGGQRFVGRGAGRERAISTTHPAMTRTATTRPAMTHAAAARPSIAHPVAAHRTVRPVRR